MLSSSLRECVSHEPNMSIHVRRTLGHQQGLSRGLYDIATWLEDISTSLMM